MTLKTVRFNDREEIILKTILSFYHKDFSTCVKELLAEKLEDLKDTHAIRRIKEGSRKDYYTADQISSLF